ncbi:MAG: argininosuccinate synthase [Thermodesulfobacteriota bacterium]|nr:argininosuccinate synthase [Thermodesulfobacteriota bacterium]|tara:strand:- start:1492 stop:2685 length:1194 start_codon:yes stop_codon:yes gene_type:complete
MMKKKTIILAYSGGLDTSVILHWLKENYNANIVAYIADLGQNENLKSIAAQAKKVGASKVYVEDLRNEFVKDFIFPMIQSSAVYEGSYLLGTSIARPLIAKRQIEIAKKEKAYAVSHGSTGKGNDQIRFELTFKALNPKIEIIAPWRIWNLESRECCINYAKEHGIPITVTKAKPYSCDRNIYHTSYEGGVLEDPWVQPPTGMIEFVKPVEQTPNKATYLNISFKEGIPYAINSKKINPLNLLIKLNQIGAKNGVGVIDIVENRFVGMKSRGVYETPGGTILNIAHRAIESLTMDREVMHLRDTLVPKISELIYNGFWFSPEMKVLQAFIKESQKNVSGDVRLKIYKGNATVLGRKSKKSLYSSKLATFEKDNLYNQGDASGFIKLNSLRLILNKIK